MSTNRPRGFQILMLVIKSLRNIYEPLHAIATSLPGTDIDESLHTRPSTGTGVLVVQAIPKHEQKSTLERVP